MHAQTSPAEDLLHKKALFSSGKSGPRTQGSDLYLRMLLRESSSSTHLFGELVPGKRQSISSQEGFKSPCLAGPCSPSVCLSVSPYLVCRTLASW